MEEEKEDKSDRLQILKEDELKLLYDRPLFSNEEREIYFYLDKSEEKILENYRSLNSKINFILQLGYFKYKYKFFSFDLNEVKEDISFIIKRLFNNKNVDIKKLEDVNNKTKLENQKTILKIFKYKNFDEEAKKIVEEKITISVKISAKPRYLFKDIVFFLEDKRIIFPSYSFMQRLIRKTLITEESRLIDIIEKTAGKEFIEELDKLILLKNVDFYEITSIKHSPNDFKYGEIKEEISRGNKIKKLYPVIKKLIPLLLISNESIKYYSSLIDFYSVYRLNQLDIRIVRVYLICFLYHRFHKLNDNLINSLKYNISLYDEESTLYSYEKIIEYKLEGNKNLKKAGKVLKIFINKKIPNNEKFKKTKRRAFKLLDEKKLATVADYIENKAMFDDDEFKWEYIDKISAKFKRNLRPLILSLDFSSLSKKSHLIDAVNLLKKNIRQKNALFEFKDNFIPKKMLKYMLKDSKIIPERCEYLIYTLLCDHLDSGDIYCSDSIKFRSLESELINEEEFKNKEKYIKELGLKNFDKSPEKHLLDLENILESKIISVNKKIKSGENTYFEMNKTVRKDRWHINTPTNPEGLNQHLFDSLGQIDIIDVIYFTIMQTNLIESFEHILGRSTKEYADKKSIAACVLAIATNMGVTKMADISDLTYNKLISALKNFVRLETGHDACSKISNEIFKSPIFQKYHMNLLLHSGLDGQKFEVKVPTINARNSSKYFGRKKGIVSYTMVANNVPTNSKIISPNEHESHHVFDIIFNNKNDIQPEIHSTDTHGTNEVNFAILYTFGHQFAPRYKDFHDVFTDSLGGFKNLNEYANLNLKPKKKFNTKIIIEEWDNIQKIMISLGVKKTTQSIITGKLSSHAHKSKTKNALWEYNRILKSIYLLDYIDSPELRQNVQKALTRVESYHQLKRSVAYANFGKLKFKTEEEQQLWDVCARLITLCIIFYNESLFLNLMETGTWTEEMIKLMSPVAWQHINLMGRYEFNKKEEKLDLNDITRRVKNR